jgi:hypothetical protein
LNIKKEPSIMEINAKSQRALLWASLILSQIYTIGYVYLVDFWPPMPPMLDASQVAELYARHNLQFRAGTVLMMLSSAFYLLFTVVVGAQIARCEKGYPIWSKLQLLGGTLGTLMLNFPPFIWSVAAFTVDGDPAITRVIHAAGWLCFVSTPTFFMLQMIAIGVIAFSKNNDSLSAFPRWLGYISFWTALGSVFGLAAVLFKIGPFAWNGALAFYLPLVVFAVWFVSLYVSLFKAIGRQERAARPLQGSYQSQYV